MDEEINMHDEIIINQRLNVWAALSELFLDTELTDRDYEYIAKVVIKSRYTPIEIDNILWFEVFPVLQSNLRDPAGVWSGYPRDWLKENLQIVTNPPSTIEDTETAKDIKDCWKRVCKFLPKE